MDIKKTIRSVRKRILLDLAGHVEYCSMHKPPEGYTVYRTPLGRLFWVTGNGELPDKFKGATPIEYEGKRSKPQTRRMTTEKIHEVYGNEEGQSKLTDEPTEQPVEPTEDGNQDSPQQQ